MSDKLIEVDTIYAQMCEFSDRSYRPHPWVMGFSYEKDGAVSVWWDHMYESTEYAAAKLDMVDWMHENNFVADQMVNLIPLPDEKNLTLPGILISWNPISRGAKISKLAEEYIKELKNVT